MSRMLAETACRIIGILDASEVYAYDVVRDFEAALVSRQTLSAKRSATHPLNQLDETSSN